MRFGTRLGNDFWISMGPLGWFIYFFVVRPVFFVIWLVLVILIGLWKLGAWCIRKVAIAINDHNQVG